MDKEAEEQEQDIWTNVSSSTLSFKQYRYYHFFLIKGLGLTVFFQVITYIK